MWDEVDEGAHPAVLRVGAARELKRPSAAAQIARDGDVIEIDAGIYAADAAVWRQHRLTIRGLGGRAQLRADGAHAEGKNTCDHVAVVRADPPQHRVVAVAETASKRYDERTAADDAWLSGEHRAASVADRPNPRSRMNVVVEEDTYPRWCGPEHGAVPGNGPQEPGMGPGGLGEGQGTEQGEEKKGPNGQRFKKTSRARC